MPALAIPRSAATNRYTIAPRPATALQKRERGAVQAAGTGQGSTRLDVERRVARAEPVGRMRHHSPHRAARLGRGLGQCAEGPFDLAARLRAGQQRFHSGTGGAPEQTQGGNRFLPRSSPAREPASIWRPGRTGSSSPWRPKAPSPRRLAPGRAFVRPEVGLRSGPRSSLRAGPGRACAADRVSSCHSAAPTPDRGRMCRWSACGGVSFPCQRASPRRIGTRWPRRRCCPAPARSRRRRCLAEAARLLRRAGSAAAAATTVVTSGGAGPSHALSRRSWSVPSGARWPRGAVPPPLFGRHPCRHRRHGLDRRGRDAAIEHIESAVMDASGLCRGHPVAARCWRR